ncbi:Envelope glycoprotein [Phlyctochytrium planicorne]|nr:Envelope glycoprotein [Phlyctochytrium planicorne]
MSEDSVVRTSSNNALVGVANPHTIVLKRAPPPEVLDEDTYIDAMSDIIERDFFPGLKKLKLQNEFLDAVQSADLGRAKSLGLQLHRMATGAAGTTSSGHNPPAPEPGSDKKLDSSLGLDAFQTKYTSEDNASFSAILQKQNDERREKYHWFFEKESGRMLLANGEPEMKKSAGLIEAPAGGSLETKQIDTWKFKAKNELMYPLEGAPQTLGDLKEARGPPKSISHSATRFTSSHSTKDVLQASRESAERLQTQEVWREMAKTTPALFPNAGSETPDGGSNKGFNMVPSTPSLEPHKDIDPSELMTWGMIEGTPLLLESGGDHSGSGPAFSIAPTPKREQILDKLAGEASKSLRKRATGKESFLKPLTPSRHGGLTPSHPFASRSDLTPKRGATPSYRAGTPITKAAQDLFAKGSKSGSSLLALAAARGIGGDPQLRATYSSPAIGTARRPSSVSSISRATPNPLSARSATPSQPSKKPSTSAASTSSSSKPASMHQSEKSQDFGTITDDLLNF